MIALSQQVRVTTRASKGNTYSIEFDDAWLKEEGWKLPVYRVDPIAESSTVIEMSRLRQRIEETDVSDLRDHLGATYGKILKDSKVRIVVDDKDVKGEEFEKWAFPPGFEPQRYKGLIPVKVADSVKNVRCEIVAGLSSESSPSTGDYGVFFYCNRRLIACGLHDHTVGFVKGVAGLPHPKVSLVRVVVMLEGEAQLMPWNSSKSGVNPNNLVFVILREWLVSLIRGFAALSRGWTGQWPDKVFKHDEGTIRTGPLINFDAPVKTYMPQMPVFRPRFDERTRQANAELTKSKPWVRGLYESISAVNLIQGSRLAEKNRIALIILDSTLEIAFKEFLVNDSGTYYSDQDIVKLFRERHNVHAEVKKFPKKARISKKTWKTIQHFYNLRCKFVHERAAVQVLDEDLNNFRKVVQSTLGKLAGLQFPEDEE